MPHKRGTEMNRGRTIQIFNYANIIKGSSSVVPFPSMRLIVFLYILWNLFTQSSRRGPVIWGINWDWYMRLWKMYFLTISKMWGIYGFPDVGEWQVPVVPVIIYNAGNRTLAMSRLKSHTFSTVILKNKQIV